MVRGHNSVFDNQQAEASNPNKNNNKITKQVILKQHSILELENTLSRETSTNSKSLDSGYEPYWQNPMPCLPFTTLYSSY